MELQREFWGEAGESGFSEWGTSNLKLYPRTVSDCVHSVLDIWEIRQGF